MLKRWLRILSTYDFDVIHRPGTQHANADALSRAPHAPNLSETEATELLEDDQIVTMGASLLDDQQSVSSDDPDVDIKGTEPSDQPSQSSNIAIPKGLMQQQQSDPLLRKVREWVHSGKKPTRLEYKALNADEKQYVDIFETLRFDNKGVLRRYPLDSTSQVSKPCIPSSLQNKVFRALHAKNHGGGDALADAVQSRFYFPRLVTLSRQYVFQCPCCQKLAKKKSQHHTYRYDITGSPREKVCLDFVGPLRKTKWGNVALLTLVDVYTRWFHAWPVKNQTTDTVIKILIKDYIPLRGVPAVVHCDNGPAFIAQVFKTAMTLFDIRTTMTPVYNPKSNAVERYHRTLKRKLTALIHEFDDEWDEALPATLLAMRTIVHRTTGHTPFFLEHGREAHLPIDLISGNPNDGFTRLDSYVTNMKDKFHRAHKVVAEQQNSYILRQQELYREHEKRIKVDDLVWVYSDKPNPELNRKFQSFWSGPYRVVEQVTNVNLQGRIVWKMDQGASKNHRRCRSIEEVLHF